MNKRDKKKYEKAIKLIASYKNSLSCIALSKACGEYTYRSKIKVFEDYVKLFNDSKTLYWLDRQIDFNDRYNDEFKRFLRIMLLTLAQEVL